MTDGKFIREPGCDIKSGEIVLEVGQELRAAELGLLASVGKVD